MQTVFRSGIVAAFFAAALACASQETWEMKGSEPPKTTPTGSLSGTVYCADTNQPARLAEVRLFRISDTEFSSQGYGQTDLDGRFSLHGLLDGEYYVVAVLPGYANYLSSLTKAHLDAMTTEDRKNLLAQIPSVTVTADQPAQVSVRIERGAELDGTVTYDDGSPAIGLRISYKLKSPDPEGAVRDSPMYARAMAEQMYQQNGQPVTDDRGHFRILGVPPGEYMVHVTVPVWSSEQGPPTHFGSMLGGPYGAGELEVFTGGVLRASKAQVIEVDAGGASKDADIVIPLSKLHTIRGQVLLKSSNQPPVTANVQLLYADTKEEVRSVFAPNGQFEFFYVSEDSYVLRAAAGAQAPPDLDALQPGPQHVVWRMPQAGEGSPELPLLVTGNVENLTIAVPDPETKKKGPTMEINWGGGSGFTSIGTASGISDDSSADSNDNPQ